MSPDLDHRLVSPLDGVFGVLWGCPLGVGRVGDLPGHGGCPLSTGTWTVASACPQRIPAPSRLPERAPLESRGEEVQELSPGTAGNVFRLEMRSRESSLAAKSPSPLGAGAELNSQIGG